MAILARSSGVSGTAWTAPNGASGSGEGVPIRRFLLPASEQDWMAEPVQEIVVVPVGEIVAQLPEEALSREPIGEKSVVQVTPLMDVTETKGPISFEVAAIQQACPHLFRPGYRVHPGAVIHIPEDQVFLGFPNRPQLSATPSDPTLSTATSLT